MKRILIAHQSSIPHYRVPFYNSLNELRPNTWTFDVVFDPSEIKKKKFFKDEFNLSDIKFSTLNVNTHSIRINGRTLTYQDFWLKCRKYDLIILEDAINNLAYPLCKTHHFFGKKIAYWGLGKDRKVKNHNPLTYLVNELKLSLNRSADGYFSYTGGVKKYLIENGLSGDRIFPINNTIDINKHRSIFNKLIADKEIIKSELGVAGKRTLLFVSTFKKSKRVGFLLKSFSKLLEIDDNYHLLLVGGGGENYSEDISSNTTYFGSITDINKLAPIYIASDIFAYPGQVGLAPLQAICYDLPVITIDSHFTHGPEIEYLTPENSIILDQDTNPEDYAQAIDVVFKHRDHLEQIRSSSWSSIKHLTIDKMAQNFIHGVNKILE